MTRYLGVRFEDTYREPGCEPFRYDYPTVDVGHNAVRRIVAVADGLDVDHADVRSLLRADDEPYVHEGHIHDAPDPFRLEPYEIEWLVGWCRQFVASVERAVDLDVIAAEAAGRDPYTAREKVGEFRHDCWKTNERVSDTVDLCETARELGVSLDVY